MMPAVIFIIVIIALCFLIGAFNESFWEGLSLIFGGLTWICVVAGFMTGFGFLILWPMAYIMFKAFDACAEKSARKKEKAQPAQAQPAQAQQNKKYELDRYYQAFAVAATEERRQFCVNKINELRKELGYDN